MIREDFPLLCMRARACGALRYLGGNFVSAPGRFSIEGFGVSFVFLVQQNHASMIPGAKILDPRIPWKLRIRAPQPPELPDQQRCGKAKNKNFRT